MSLRIVCSVLVMSLAVSGGASAQSPPLTTTEAMIPSSDPGIKLYVRNKHAEGMTSFSPDKTPHTRRKQASTCRSTACR